MQIVIEIQDDLYQALSDHLPCPVEEAIHIFVTALVKGVAFGSTRPADLEDSLEVIGETSLVQFLSSLGLFDFNCNGNPSAEGEADDV